MKEKKTKNAQSLWVTSEASWNSPSPDTKWIPKWFVCANFPTAEVIVF